MEETKSDYSEIYIHERIANQRLRQTKAKVTSNKYMNGSTYAGSFQYQTKVLPRCSRTHTSKTNSAVSNKLRTILPSQTLTIMILKKIFLFIYLFNILVLAGNDASFRLGFHTKYSKLLSLTHATTFTLYNIKEVFSSISCAPRSRGHNLYT